ncbi:peptide N-acetyl-beta-D-glucosaminyl asparaginase amidase A-domain-containing protein [Xylaria sp. CBS 124048]|nr:peptide N-acetyl-beta-D-glucosaminyl asparaginase amidase A-domain-containing protein [Xylaria sp. CBS 124048]
MKVAFLPFINLLAGTALAKGNVIHPFTERKSLALGSPPDDFSDSASASPRPPLECFQVAEPVVVGSGIQRRDESQSPVFVPAGQQPITPVYDNEDAIDVDGEVDVDVDGHAKCAVVLMKHSFANSYGAPFVGKYTPPSCAFDHVVINFTARVQGRQFDRTGVLYLTDTEVWRTSTAEPTAYGIRWAWLKDMSAFLSLWRAPQTVIFDLENIVDGTYTGIINTTLTATFFTRRGETGANGTGHGHGTSYTPADLIIPISKRLGQAGQPSQFVYPTEAAVTTVVDFPRNANRAVVTLDVKGQANEEFWWSNVPQSAAHAFNATYGPYPAYSPFREVQLRIDGYLAGVAWPFPVIYTGGVVPQLHRPIVGIQAFDILEPEIEISPFLPRLCDGRAHVFEIKILGLVDDGRAKAGLSTTTGDEWYVTGKVFVWLDEDAGSVTTGNFSAKAGAPAPPDVTISQNVGKDAMGRNETLSYTLTVKREKLAIASYVKTQKTAGTVSWEQELSYSNVGGVTGYGFNNINKFLISGVDRATSSTSSGSGSGSGSGSADRGRGRGRGGGYEKKYEYPLFCNSSQQVLPEGNLSIWAELRQGLRIESHGTAAMPLALEGFVSRPGRDGETGEVLGSRLWTEQNGTAFYRAPGNNQFSVGGGETRQVFSFAVVRRGEANANANANRNEDGNGNGNGNEETLYYRDVRAVNDSVTDDRVKIGR